MELQVEQNKESVDTLCVLQITDTHLYADPEKSLLGINTLESFRRVLALGISNPHRKPDIIIATGDLVHDASAAGYRRLAKEFETCQIPVYCLPGNHDKALVMNSCLEDHGVSTQKVLDRGRWRIILLDSTIPDQEGGRLSAGELELLEHSLANTDRNVMVCLHHQPLPVGSEWIDKMALENGEEFFRLVRQHPRVKAVIWGHIHQDYHESRDGVQLFATPSTCIQFAPGIPGFKVDDSPPGCRLLTLEANGQLSSLLLTTEQVPVGADLGSAGY